MNSGCSESNGCASCSSDCVSTTSCHHTSRPSVQGTSVSANTTIYVGPDTVQTATGPVATRHLRLITALSGQSSGGAVRELWLDPDGLVVKEQRQVNLRVRSGFVGLLTYQEQATFLLTGRPSPDLR